MSRINPELLETKCDTKIQRTVKLTDVLLNRLFTALPNFTAKINFWENIIELLEYIDLVTLQK